MTLVAVIVAVPGAVPRNVALAEKAPAGIVTVGVSTDTREGSLEVIATMIPPAGAALGASVTGMLVVSPSGTARVVGTLIRFTVTTTLSVASLKFGAVPRIVAVPAATPFRRIVPVVWPWAIAIVPGAPTEAMPGASLVRVTIVPPAGAASPRTTRSVALRSTPMTDVPSNDSVIVWLSSFRIVPVACAVPRVAFTGLERFTTKVSAGSTAMSPLISTLMFCTTTPGLKVTVPVAA